MFHWTICRLIMVASVACIIIGIITENGFLFLVCGQGEIWSGIYYEIFRTPICDYTYRDKIAYAKRNHLPFYYVGTKKYLTYDVEGFKRHTEVVTEEVYYPTSDPKHQTLIKTTYGRIILNWTEWARGKYDYIQ